MSRVPSKYERAWRERAGHAASGATAEVAPPPPPPPPTPEPGADQAESVSVTGRVVELEFKSSNVRKAVFDGSTGIVEVTFKDGAARRYLNFTDELMDAWRAAKSAGSWFHEHVKSQPDLHPIVADGK